MNGLQICCRCGERIPLGGKYQDDEWSGAPFHYPKCVQAPKYASIVDYVVSEIAPEMTRLLEQGLGGKADPLADERKDVLARFTEELAKATGDGSKKRQAGEKPPWYKDAAHAAAMYRHLERWEVGEKHDPDHEAHPLVAMAWRALAIACKESGNIPNG